MKLNFILILWCGDIHGLFVQKKKNDNIRRRITSDPLFQKRLLVIRPMGSQECP